MGLVAGSERGLDNGRAILILFRTWTGLDGIVGHSLFQVRARGMRGVIPDVDAGGGHGLLDVFGQELDEKSGEK